MKRLAVIVGAVLAICAGASAQDKIDDHLRTARLNLVKAYPHVEAARECMLGHSGDCIGGTQWQADVIYKRLVVLRQLWQIFDRNIDRAADSATNANLMLEDLLGYHIWHDTPRKHYLVVSYPLEALYQSAPGNETATLELGLNAADVSQMWHYYNLAAQHVAKNYAEHGSAPVNAHATIRADALDALHSRDDAALAVANGDMRVLAHDALALLDSSMAATTGVTQQHLADAHAALTANCESCHRVRDIIDPALTCSSGTYACSYGGVDSDVMPGHAALHGSVGGDPTGFRATIRTTLDSIGLALQSIQPAHGPVVRDIASAGHKVGRLWMWFDRALIRFAKMMHHEKASQ